MITQKTRFPIQMVAITHDLGYIPIVLCNDGTIWRLIGPKEWAQLPEIPQPKENT